MNAPNLFKMPARSIDLEILMNEYNTHIEVARAFREDGLVALRREMWFDSNRFESSANYARAHNAIQSARRTKRKIEALLSLGTGASRSAVKEAMEG